jgi:hypothetical protein
VVRDGGVRPMVDKMKRRSPKLISSINNFFGTGRAQSEKVGQISFRPLIFSFPYAHAASPAFWRAEG